MHNKFCVIDGQAVITGSFNWSYKARQNHENITIFNRRRAVGPTVHRRVPDH
jgi:phosphatidylserine/phosphatidylglycerophosphate/cardiolipin synthase-like enzyme